MIDAQRYIETFGLTPYDPFTETLYKYVSVETAKKILEGSSLKFSIASDFNDPFELTIDHIDFTTSKEEFWSLIKRTHKGTRAEKRNLYKENKNKPQVLADGLRTALDTMKQEFGICCFSKNHNHTLMWSHYATNHYGVCLGFKGFIPNNTMFIFHVKYVDKLDSIKYWTKEREKLIPLWIYTKSLAWAYEEEIRATHIKYNGLVNFPSEALTEIYYGLRTSQSDIQEIETILQSKGYNAQRFKMERVKTTFDLVANPFN